MTKVFIDGSAGTTGLRIYERLSQRKDIELLILTGENRKNNDARRQMLSLAPSLGFSRQEHWSGLPFPSPMHESESEVVQSCLTLSDP